MRLRYGYNVNDYDGFYRKNKDKLFAYLLRMTGNYYQTCDLVQESFTRYLSRYTDDRASLPLLYTIARNAALDEIRKKTAESSDSGDLKDPCKNPEQQMMDRQAFDRMLAAIKKLSSPDRELISLVATGDLSYREIGNVLNVSEASIKVKVHRARTRLREIMASGGE